MELTKTNYVDQAEKVMSTLKKDRDNKIILTTSKIRNILTTTATIYDNVKRSQGKLSMDEVSDVQNLRLKLVYEYGRDEDGKRENGVKDFINKSNLIEEIKKIGDDREKLIIYCKYVEALVAYHRYFGGKD
ncbi:type III-A CRISPR-associated protein Csm2 [Peptoniphilus duerdenii]|uniref:type III-A CRISPR-associated protein Csm2 n=1 Tax=Peptoniphilus duerdenii TaxID=507750 RepID=UPI0023F39B3E|nr:type III-A CRISPR-associated protein Csm2 [Peptoniphilus duerdenii]